MMNLPQVIIISGTPGVGKTTVCKILSKKGFTTFNLNDFIIQKGLYFGYDFSLESVIIDDNIMQEKLKEEFLKYSKTVFIEGHTAELVPKVYVILAFVLRCNPSILRKRLEESRNYSKSKIKENVEAEIMDECYLNVKDSFIGISIIEIDTSFITPEDVANQIINFTNASLQMF